MSLKRKRSRRRTLNGELFRKYVQQELAPHLRSGDILVLDNLPTHKVSGVVEAVQARDARVLFLPPYSPDFNPIEQVFSKIKNELRRRQHRTIDALENAFGESLDWITMTDALLTSNIRATRNNENESALDRLPG